MGSSFHNGPYSCLPRLLYHVFGKREFRIAMFSLPASGSTTILYKWKLGEVVQVIPTLGFNVETIDYKNGWLTLWDLGGGNKIRPLWRHYFPNTQGVIYVIDASEPGSMAEVKAELERLMAEKELRGLPFLIFANKQDKKGAMREAEIGVRLGVTSWGRDRKWRIVECSAVSETLANGDYSDGLQEGLVWLYDQLMNSSWNHDRKSDMTNSTKEAGPYNV